MEICLLGEFSLIYQGRRLTALDADRPRTLLAYLLLHRGSPQSRQQIAFTLWPDSTEGQARTNLRNLIFTLRQALPDADAFLVTTTHTLQWRPEARFSLDLADFQAALRRAEQSMAPDDQRRQLETAIAAYRGPLLPGIYDDWLIPIREALHQDFLGAHQELAALLESSGEYAQAIRHARLLQQEDLLNEAATVRVMRLHALAGDRAGVHRAYRACAEALSRELDVEPAPDTQAAYGRLLRLAEETTGAAGAEAEPQRPLMPTARSSPRDTGQLPPQLSPFVGREEEQARIAELLVDPQCRLLTIVGPGGVGKTRLALRAAYAHVTVFAHGAAFVPLASVSDPQHIPGTIAQSLRFPLAVAVPRRAQLLAYLSMREMLLVLDNMEQLSADLSVLEEILANAPGIKLLVTSRQRLDLAEEWTFELQGLPLPEEAETVTLEDAGAAHLFLQTARRFDASFGPSDDDRKAIARICRLVAGMPLALELAASWVRVLSCEEIGDEIEKNLDFLSSAQRHVPSRHRSMRAVFDQSWDLLSPQERSVFSTLSLFRGGFDRDAAAQVAGATLPILAVLLDKSLVRRLDNGRFDVHELLRQYATERLAGDARLLSLAQERFRAHFLLLAETAAAQLTGPDQETWLARLEVDYGNLRLTLEQSLARDTDTALRLVVALGRFWWLRCRHVEGSQWLRRALALPSPPSALRASAMAYAGLLARVQQAFDEAERWLVASIALERELGDKKALGRSLNELGMLYMDRGELEQAEPLFVEWLALASELAYPHGVAIALLNLGMVAHLKGQKDVARGHFQEGLAISRQMGLLSDLAMLLNSYGMLLATLQEVDEAKAALRESLRLHETLGNKDGLSWSLIGLGSVAQLEGRPELAAQLLGMAAHAREMIGAPLPPVNQAHLDRLLAELAVTMGEEDFRRLYDGDQKLSPSETLAAALEGW
jgi:predicted ATPase/DNA-binding SARP family transcriptional activator